MHPRRRVQPFCCYVGSSDNGTEKRWLLLRLKREHLRLPVGSIDGRRALF